MDTVAQRFDLVQIRRVRRTAARAEQDVSVFLVSMFRRPAFPSPPNTIKIPTFIYAQPGSRGSLHAERTQGIELGYRKQFSPALSADMNVYRYHYKDLRSGGCCTGADLVVRPYSRADVAGGPPSPICKMRRSISPLPPPATNWRAGVPVPSCRSLAGDAQLAPPVLLYLEAAWT